MSSKSNDQGRAYEYVWINILKNELNKTRKVSITENSSLKANENAWNAMDEYIKHLFTISAQSAVDTIIELEPMLKRNDDTVYLSFNKDELGQDGDVRDIVIRQNNICWEIGLSIKHNHEAIKHSRLSSKLDFGEKWFGVQCSEHYWNEVNPIFSKLEDYKNKKYKWSDLENKERDVYVPLLEAFISEIERSYKKDRDLPRKMIEYLVGTKDYYKIVSKDSDKVTIINTFNLHGTLNKPNGEIISSINVPVVDLPSELILIRFKPHSKNTVEMYLNNGWQLSFRIHNASTEVESSLKFDIKFIGSPTTIISLKCFWNNVE